MLQLKKSQGEIFGIALMFVIIILGVIIYGKIQATKPDNNVNIHTENKYKILAEGSLNSILKMSTGCEVERNRDRLIDLINYCIQNSFDFNSDPPISCDSGNYGSCTHAKNLINSSLNGFLNTSLLGPIPYKLMVILPRSPHFNLNENYSNFNSYSFHGKFLTDNRSNTDATKIYYMNAGFNRAPSGIRTWATSNGNIEFELYLFYR